MAAQRQEEVHSRYIQVGRSNDEQYRFANPGDAAAQMYAFALLGCGEMCPPGGDHLPGRLGSRLYLAVREFQHLTLLFCKANLTLKPVLYLMFFKTLNAPLYSFGKWVLSQLK